MKRSLLARATRRLDDRVVPALAVAIYRARRGARRLAAATGRPGRAVTGLARRRPMIVVAVLLGAMAIALLAVTGGDFGGGVAPHDRRSLPPGVPGDQLGPSVNEPVASYLSQAAGRLQSLRSQPARTRVVALVDFNSYLAPISVRSLLGSPVDLGVVRAFAQPPPPAHGQIHALTLTGISELAGALRQTRAASQQVVTTYRTLTRDVRAQPSVRGQQLLETYADRAKQARADVRGLGAGRGCVFAMVVEGPISAIERVATQPSVRVVDVAPLERSLDDLLVVPLEPGTTGKITSLNFASQ